VKNYAISYGSRAACYFK